MEHRCCIKFLNIKGKLVFDGSIENLDCMIYGHFVPWSDRSKSDRSKQLSDRSIK